MSGTNQYLGFAGSGTANALTPAAYAALTALLANGFQSGLAQSQQINTVFRQTTTVAAAVAQFIVNITGGNANDDGNVSEFTTNLTTAVREALTLNENSWGAAQQGAQIPVQPVASGATLTLNFALGNNFVIGAGTGVTSAITANFILGNPTGATAGQSGVITFVQDSVGSHTITSRGSAWKGSAGARANLTAGANGVDELTYYVEYNGNIVLAAGNNIS
jgi:hypothetical protein